MKTSDKIILLLGRDKNWTKIKLAEYLGMSRPTLDERLNNNSFSIGELILLKKIGIK